ncbi:Conserved hypothetical protein containing TPR repeat, secreted [Salinibacter ruber M8]|uniref:CHAT domain-containing protein n=2 Tax=Salinibacter ruber TaxID=146919 RepID=A0A9X2V6D9_9BACT|nr:CHAT domain-containing protein [Salinibacter ruber]MCS4120649.1 CHAT domain-containing protein [Salinibacter ruber]CBH22987.1 Conserved hypothetical protein containing TPR repeat, secreted [Salinibacter ruber M8]
MLVVLLATSLLVVPPFSVDAADDLDACLRQAPVQSPPPINWGEGVPQMWSSTPPVPRDTVRAYLSQVRAARACFRTLDPSRVERPYLGNIMRTFQVETALLAALRRFADAFEAFEDARSYLNAAPNIPSAEGTRTGWIRALHQDQGFLHFRIGNLSASITHYTTALRKTSEHEVGLRVTHLLDVGLLHQYTQDYRSARRYYTRARRLAREHDRTSEEHPSEWARLLYLQANLLLEETLNTEFDRASLRRARDLARKGRSLATSSDRRIDLALALSESLGYLGSFDRAYALNAEVRRYAQARDDAQLRAFALLKLGVLHMQTERWTEAESVLNTSLAIAERMGNLDQQRRIRRGLGRLHELQQNWATAEDQYRAGVAVIKRYRESLTATQWASTAFAQWRDVHRGLVRTLLAQNQPRAALAALDRTRARYLRDLRTRNRVATQLSPATRARFDSLGRALTDVRNRLGTDSLSDATEAALRARKASLMANRQRVLRLDSARTPRPSVDEIAASIAQQDRALVSYFLDAPWPVYDRPPRSAAFVLTGDTLQAVALPGLSQDSIRAHVNTISSLFADRQASRSISAMHFNLRPLRALHDRLYAPVAAHLPDGQPLTVIPDGPMFHVPFSMLATAAPGGRYDHEQARFVLHERPTALDLSASLATDTSATRGDAASSSSDLAAFGVSSFDPLRPPPPSLPSSRADTTAASSLSLPPLPGVRSEINALDRLFDDAKTFLDEQATEPAFAAASQEADVLHLASHALVSPSSSLRNAFLLHPDSSSDGLLFLHELQTRDRALPLAVLSGCNTARGTLRGGEGMAGLQYAFRIMGAQSTVSNLWPTADRSSVALMESFYENLRAGQPKDQALRRAKLTYLENHPDNLSPFFWASAVLYGSPRPLQMNASDGSSLRTWGPVALALLVVLLGWSLVRFRSQLGLDAFHQ